MLVFELMDFTVHAHKSKTHFTLDQSAAVFVLSDDTPHTCLS